VCNPSNSTCVNATTTTTTTTNIGTKMEEDFNIGERIGDGASSDSTTTVSKGEQPSENRSHIGIIIGAAIGGIVVLSIGLYCGVKVTKNYKKNKATRAPSLKKANSIANPTLQKQMTDNQAKYAVVP
jgi:anaerobic C4-dicarboxylate transporter